nr:MAG TPA: hypothetical protein [Caudoviricetes sp.]
MFYVAKLQRFFFNLPNFFAIIFNIFYNLLYFNLLGCAFVSIALNKV